MEQPWSPSRAAVLAAIVGLVLLAGAGTLLLPAAADTTHSSPQKLVEPKQNESVFWPYTSKRQSAESRTLAINVVVYGDAETVQWHLTSSRDASWNETAEEWRDIDPDDGTSGETGASNATVVEWGAASGSTRYFYVHDHTLTREQPGETTRRPHRALAYTGPTGTDVGGTWVTETAQLHDGTYFGQRHHLRLYESPFPADDWVAIQAHSEHWDWFRLRHTVHGTEVAQNRIEQEFLGEPFVDSVWRMYLDNSERSDSDGWATVVDLYGAGAPGAAVLVPAGAVILATGRRRRRRDVAVADRPKQHVEASASLPLVAPEPVVRWLYAWDRLDSRQVTVVVRSLSYGLLFAALLGLYLGVRFGGILLEGLFPATSPKLIAGLLYPWLALGLPACAYVAGRGLERVRSFAAAATGIGTAIVLDYQYLAVTVLPLDVVLHRLGLVVALGLVAAGAVSRVSPRPTVNRLFGAGVVLWVVSLVAPLVGWL